MSTIGTPPMTASWWTTSTPSAVLRTSSSTASAPRGAAAVNAAMVLPRSTRDAPRWATIQGRPEGGGTRGAYSGPLNPHTIAPPMHVYNTLGRALQDFEPRTPGEVSMYVCGPTVQSAPHFGHGRPAGAFDVIRRYLTWRGFRVTYVSNITDIEDKIINAAAEQGITAEEVARRATSQFLDAYARLRVLPSDDLVYAT